MACYRLDIANIWCELLVWSVGEVYSTLLPQYCVERHYSIRGCLFSGTNTRDAIILGYVSRESIAIVAVAPPLDALH